LPLTCAVLCLCAFAYAVPAGAATSTTVAAHSATVTAPSASHHVCYTQTTHQVRACFRLAHAHRRRTQRNTHRAHGARAGSGSHHGHGTHRAGHTAPSHTTPSHDHHHATARQAPVALTPAQSEGDKAAVVAKVLATPCQDTMLTPEAGNLEAVQAATLCLVNQVRAGHDELPLVANGMLERAAVEHSQEMVELDYFAHIAPDGLTPVDRVRNAGYIPSPDDGYTIGENIAWGTLEYSTPAAIVRAWVASPEHLANILESHYKDTAVGVAAAAPPTLANGEQGAVYSQEFGVIVQ
jgi:uncharacterized protein YkwD